MKKLTYMAPQISVKTLDPDYNILAASNEGFGEKSGVYDNWPEMS